MKYVFQYIFLKEKEIYISFCYIYPQQNKSCLQIYIDGLMQERRYSIANALELRLSCTNPST